MFGHDAAPLCRAFARAWTAPRRIAATLVATVAVTAMIVVPAAVARGRRCAGSHIRIGSASRHVLQHAVVCLINQQRRARGLPALRQSRLLNRSAQGWTNKMVAHSYFSHGADFGARISSVGFNWSNVGENIATGFGTPAGVVRAWMASTGHCQNILSPTFRYVGTGLSGRAIAGHSSHPGTWTQDFGLGMGERRASGNWSPAVGCPYR
jgi:uncharacterized protein YkwD